jgi:hypothetical protein
MRDQDRLATGLYNAWNRNKQPIPDSVVLPHLDRPAARCGPLVYPRSGLINARFE